MSSTPRFGVLAACLLLACAGEARAEIVVLSSGTTLDVRAYRVDGETVTLQLRAGGEVTCSRSLVQAIVPDEIPPGRPQDARGVRPRAAARAVSGPYSELITSLAQAHGVDPMLVRALIQVESNYRPRARSHRGAMGLMQLMPAVARQYNVSNPYDPRANVAAGIKHLKSLIDRWGVELALAAYNAGEGAVKKFNGIPPYRETRHYVSRILALAGVK